MRVLPQLSTIIDETEPESSCLNAMDANRGGNDSFSSAESSFQGSNRHFGEARRSRSFRATSESDSWNRDHGEHHSGRIEPEKRQSAENNHSVSFNTTTSSISFNEPETSDSSAWGAFPAKVQRYLTEKTFNSSTSNLESLIAILKHHSIGELEAKLNGTPQSEERPIQSIVSVRPLLSNIDENEEIVPQVTSLDVRKQFDSIFKETKRNIQQARQATPPTPSSSLEQLIDNIETFQFHEDQYEYPEQVRHLLMGVNDVLHFAEMDQNKIPEFCKHIDVTIKNCMNEDEDGEAVRLQSEIDLLKTAIITAESDLIRLQIESESLSHKLREANRHIGEKESSYLDLQTVLHGKEEKLMEYKELFMRTDHNNKRFRAENERLRESNAKRQNVISTARDIATACAIKKTVHPQKLLEALHRIEKECSSVKSRDSSFE